MIINEILVECPVLSNVWSGAESVGLTEPLQNEFGAVRWGLAVATWKPTHLWLQKMNSVPLLPLPLSSSNCHHSLSPPPSLFFFFAFNHWSWPLFHICPVLARSQTAMGLQLLPVVESISQQTFQLPLPYWETRTCSFLKLLWGFSQRCLPLQSLSCAPSSFMLLYNLYIPRTKRRLLMHCIWLPCISLMHSFYGVKLCVWQTLNVYPAWVIPHPPPMPCRDNHCQLPAGPSVWVPVSPTAEQVCVSKTLLRGDSFWPHLKYSDMLVVFFFPQNRRGPLTWFIFYDERESTVRKGWHCITFGYMGWLKRDATNKLCVNFITVLNTLWFSNSSESISWEWKAMLWLNEAQCEGWNYKLGRWPVWTFFKCC